MYFSCKCGTTTGICMASLQPQITSADMTLITPRRWMLDLDKQRPEILSASAVSGRTKHFCIDMRQYRHGRIIFVLLALRFDEAEKIKNKLCRRKIILAIYRREVSSFDLEPVYTSSANDNFESEKRKFQILLFIMFCVQANAKPLSDQNEPNTMSFELLSSPSCSSGKRNMSITCQTDDQCGFTCGPTYKPTCVNTQEGESGDICLPTNLTCEEGIRWVAKRDETDLNRFVVLEETCPEGTYQPYPSNCFDACRLKHRNTDNIPKQYAIYTKGDNKSPTFVYCIDMKVNNLSTIIPLNYDQLDDQHDSQTCQYDENFDYCAEGKEMLSNGTCVEPCLPGICRDDLDMFSCQLDCSSMTRMSDMTSFGQISISSSHERTSQSGNINGQTTAIWTALVTAVLNGGTFVAVLIGVIVLICHFCCKIKDKRTTRVSKSTRKHCHKTTVNSNGTTNININVPNNEFENLLNKQTTREIEENTMELKIKLVKFESLQTDEVDSELTAVKKPYSSE